MSELIVVNVNGENRVDSRIVAKHMGLDHEYFKENLEKYQKELEQLGLIRLETGAVKNPGSRGVKYQKYIMLNEDQTVFAITLSRNTPEVVQAKLDITIAFSKARKGQMIPDLKKMPLFELVAFSREMINDIIKAFSDREILLNEVRSISAHNELKWYRRAFYKACRDFEGVLVLIHKKNREEVRKYVEQHVLPGFSK